MDFEPSSAWPPEDDQPAWWFMFKGYRLLVQVTDESARVPLLDDPDALGMKPMRQQYLGLLEGRRCFSAELSKQGEPPPNWQFKSLYQLYGLLPESLFWVAGAAVQIVDWDRNHQYCGHCGAKTRPKSGERAKECPQCGLLSYPRISPAIIVLVERDGQILLARSHRHPPGRYSVLAGFVEPGETLETAVAREIREEVGIEVQEIRYFGSQPWPFPNSLMIAFTCRYASGQIALEDGELADAGWYNVDNLPRVPPRLSIARQLIDWFVDKQTAA